MNTSVQHDEPRAIDITATDDALTVRLSDGRVISTPIVWYPRLLHATPSQLQHWQLLGGGISIHWPDLDEDLSVQGMLHGRPARQPGQEAAA